MKRTHEDEDFPLLGVRVGTYIYEYRDRWPPGLCAVLCQWNDRMWRVDNTFGPCTSQTMRAVANLLDYLNTGDGLSEDSYRKYSCRAVFYLPEVIESEA